MKTQTSILAALLLAVAVAVQAADAPKPASSNDKPKGNDPQATEALKSPSSAKSKASGPGSNEPAMDPKAMEEMMMKMAAPGPYHERFKKLEGEWNATVKWTMDPSQPPQTSTSLSVIRTLMDGRYSQEDVTGVMMEKPFNGLGITGYDNVLKKYVSSWIDNMGTGIMTSQGTPDDSGKIINWTGQTADPATGKMTKFRMVSRFVDDNHHVFEMYTKAPDGKEFKTMEIDYQRKI